MVDYKTSNIIRYRYTFVVIDNFFKYTHGETIGKNFSRTPSTSKRKPLKLVSDRGKEWYNSVFQNFLNFENIHHYSRFTDKGPSIAEKVIRIVRNLLKKAVFYANWLFELPSVIKKYNNSIHHSIKMTPVQASKTLNEKEVYCNLRDRRVRQQPKINLSQLVRTADTKKVFSKGDSTNYSYKLYTITEVIQDTIPSYRLN